MLTARFDPSSGELRLPAAAIEALGGAASAPAPGVRVLEELGVIEGGLVHAAVARMAAVIRAPLVRVAVRVGRPTVPFAGRAWLDAGFAVIALSAGGQLYDLVVGQPSAMPVVIAGLVDLGPRPAPHVMGEVVLPAPAVRALLDRGGGARPEDVVEAAAVPDAWRTPLVALGDKGRRTWSASAEWMVAERRVARRQVDVVDGGDAGLWSRQPVRVQGRELTRLRPLRSRDIWRQLCTLLPSDDELTAVVTEVSLSPALTRPGRHPRPGLARRRRPPPPARRRPSAAGGCPRHRCAPG